MSTGLRDRAVGVLTGLALGDALGMPTQLLPYETIRARYGLLDDHHPGPADNEISPAVQRASAEALQASWTEDITTGHLPMLEEPARVSQRFARPATLT